MALKKHEKIFWDESQISGTLMETLPMYEFEIPNSLVGLIIGVKGKTIKVG